MKRILAAMMMGILLAHEIPVAAMRGEILYTEDVESGNENEEENAASAVEGPQIGAPSAILMEASTGKVIYEKDADKELNAFIGDYFKAITSCDNEKLQDMVTDSSEYSNNESLKKKAEFITGYDNITVYTKEGLEEGSYVAFVVSNLTIAGVNSSPYDISTLYIVTGSQGFRIQNGTLPDEISKYIEKVKGDKDIQKIYKSIEKKNEALKEKDSSLQQFYEIISRRNVETNSVADQTSEQTDDATTAAESAEPASTEAETTEAPATETPATEAPATEAAQ